MKHLFTISFFIITFISSAQNNIQELGIFESRHEYTFDSSKIDFKKQSILFILPLTADYDKIFYIKKIDEYIESSDLSKVKDLNFLTIFFKQGSCGNCGIEIKNKQENKADSFIYFPSCFIFGFDTTKSKRALGLNKLKDFSLVNFNKEFQIYQLNFQNSPKCQQKPNGDADFNSWSPFLSEVFNPKLTKEEKEEVKKREELKQIIKEVLMELLKEEIPKMLEELKQTKLEGKEIEINKDEVLKRNNLFQLSVSSSLMSIDNNPFTDFSSKQINFIVKYSFFKNKSLLIGCGMSLSQNRFNSSNNSIYSLSGNIPLEFTYAKLDAVSERYFHQAINVSAYLGFKIPFPAGTKNNSSGFEISLNPYLSLFSKLDSEIVGGSITTFGEFSEIDEYLYDIPELGLNSKSDYFIGNRINYNSSTIGMNLAISYMFKIGDISIAPNLNLNYVYIKNKNLQPDSYTFNNRSYNGMFSSLKDINFLNPTIGLSLIF
jgi:hypothetical protein